MKVYGYIYLVRNKVNGKVYVGQTTYTVAIRWQGHKDLARVDKPRMSICKAIKKYGVESFEVVELHRAYSQEELDQMETRAIEAWEATDRKFGYNVRHGGSRGSMAAESKEKLSQSLRRYFSDPNNLKQHSERHKGIKKSQAARDKQSRTTRGVPKSSSHKEAMRQDMNRRYQDPQYMERHKEAVARSYINNPELRRIRSEGNLRRWAKYREAKKLAALAGKENYEVRAKVSIA